MLVEDSYLSKIFVYIRICTSVVYIPKNIPEKVRCLTNTGIQ